MKESLVEGLRVEHAFRVPQSKTVPHLYPEAAEFAAMPAVFATGYLIGLVEWACIRALEPHLDWPREQSLGTHVDLSHEAATPPGMTVTVRGTLTRISGRNLRFEVEASDGVDVIARGTHERVVVDAERFRRSVVRKAEVGVG